MSRDESSTSTRHHRSELLRLAAAWLCALTWVVAGVPRSTANDTALTPEEIEFFEKQVRPVLVEHCYQCHGPDKTKGGLSLDSKAGTLRGGDTGAAIVPGDPEHSLLISAVRYDDRDLQMPPQGRLQPHQVAALEKWVSLGAPDPRTASATGSSPSGMSIEEGRKFWSFQAVADPSIPQVKNSFRVQTPIDAFVLAQLEQEGLQPAPAADRRMLIRRVTFDLTGLPPTPDQVAAFLADDSPEAFETVVERLLASPQYGVRWGRHWLDVARYADSNGLDENLAFGNAWRYRDFVVDAFNNDKPFDQFLVEQIAGDLIPGATRETKIATGFLVLGAKVLAEPDRDKLEMDTIDEQIDATGKAFLGMTLGCVRCHDHKFDPIKQTDYYALAAIFKSTKTLGDTNTGAIKHWHEHLFATDEELESLKAIDQRIAEKKQAASSFKNKTMADLRTQARSKAVEYLVAASRLDPSATLKVVASIAEPAGLHPRILHHCRLHLQYHADAPFFEAWHRIRDDSSTLEEAGAAIETHYRSLFARVDAALDEARKQNPKANSLDDAELDAALAARSDNSGFLAVPPKPEFAFDAETLAQYNELMEAARVTESSAPDPTAAMGVTDSAVVTSLPLHVRGSHRNLGEGVAREFPAVMRTSIVRPILPNNQSGRLELARWMASTQHPLTARVYVNRIWRWHFGAGLVRTTENFGVLGDRPSHPELLDWLARRFMQSGWSTKQLHRLILASSTYQMSSQHSDPDACRSKDPENRMLWRFPQQRLEAEQIRDAILAVSGRLDMSLRGKTVPLRNRQFVFNHTSVDHTRYDSLRRAMYLPVIRNNVYTLFSQFDFPDPTMPTGNRGSTIVAPQALWLMNSDLVMDSADELARDLLSQSASDASRLEIAYQRLLGRLPSAAESRRAVAFIDGLAMDGLLDSATVDPEQMHRAWSLYCQSLLASNEFLYLR